MPNITTVNQIHESRVILPDEAYAALYRARKGADPARISVLNGVMRAWLDNFADGGRCLLDDLDGAFAESFAFLTPECELIVVGTDDAAAAANRYAEVHGLAVAVRDGMWRVEMVAFAMDPWPSN